MSLKSSPLTLHVIPSAWICCKMGRKLPSQKWCLRTGAATDNSPCESTLQFSAKTGGVRELRGSSQGCFHSTPWRCSNYHQPRLQSPSRTGREVRAGSSTAGSCMSTAPLGSQQHKGDCPAERVRRTTLCFSTAVGHQKASWVSLRLQNKCNPKHRITPKLCCI